MRLNLPLRVALLAVAPLVAISADAGLKHGHLKHGLLKHGGCGSHGHQVACTTGCPTGICDMTYANPGYSAAGFPVAADDEPVTVDRDALRPLSPMEARLILNVPSTAVVYFGPQLMQTRGVERVYLIPVTQTGTAFPYPVTVFVPGLTGMLKQDFRAVLTGGLMTEIDVVVVPGDVEAIQATPREPQGVEEEVKEELAEELQKPDDVGVAPAPLN